MSRVYLVAGYNNQKILNDYTIYLVQTLAKTGEVYYLSNGAIPKSELQKLQDYTVCADSVIHNGNDFGSWQYLIYHYGWQNLLQYDEVVFCNDKTYATLAHLQNLSAYFKLQNYDFWSLTEKYSRNSEDNGRFVIFKHDVIKNPKFQEFWNNIIFRDKRDTYRSVLPAFLKELGYNGKTDIKNYKQKRAVKLANSAIRLATPISYGSTFAVKDTGYHQKPLAGIIKNLKNRIHLFRSGL